NAATKVSVVLIAPDAVRRAAITRAIAETPARIVREAAEWPSSSIASKLAKSDCDVIVVDLDAGVTQGVELISAICSRNPLVTVMACSSGNDADVVIRS